MEQINLSMTKDQLLCLIEIFDRQQAKDQDEAKKRCEVKRLVRSALRE